MNCVTFTFRWKNAADFKNFERRVKPQRMANQAKMKIKLKFRARSLDFTGNLCNLFICIERDAHACLAQNTYASELEQAKHTKRQLNYAIHFIAFVFLYGCRFSCVLFSIISHAKFQLFAFALRPL